MPKKCSEKLPRTTISPDSLLIGSKDDIAYITESLQKFTIKAEPCIVTNDADREVYYTQQHFEQGAAEFGKTHKLPICFLVDSVLKTIQKISGELQIILCNGGSKNTEATMLTLSAHS